MYFLYIFFQLKKQYNEITIFLLPQIIQIPLWCEKNNNGIMIKLYYDCKTKLEVGEKNNLKIKRD